MHWSNINLKERQEWDYSKCKIEKKIKTLRLWKIYIHKKKKKEKKKKNPHKKFQQITVRKFSWKAMEHEFLSHYNYECKRIQWTLIISFYYFL